jgi:hypothetical protein
VTRRGLLKLELQKEEAPARRWTLGESGFRIQNLQRKKRSCEGWMIQRIESVFASRLKLPASHTTAICSVTPELLSSVPPASTNFR